MIIDSTRDVMIDYFNKIIHGGMDIQMRGRIKVPAYLTGKERAKALKMALTPKVGTIVADPKHLEAYGRLRKEPLEEMEPMNMGFEQQNEESRRSRENAARERRAT